MAAGAWGESALGLGSIFAQKHDNSESPLATTVRSAVANIRLLSQVLISTHASLETLQSTLQSDGVAATDLTGLRTAAGQAASALANANSLAPTLLQNAESLAAAANAAGLNAPQTAALGIGNTAWGLGAGASHAAHAGAQPGASSLQFSSALMSTLPTGPLNLSLGGLDGLLQSGVVGSTTSQFIPSLSGVGASAAVGTQGLAALNHYHASSGDGEEAERSGQKRRRTHTHYYCPMCPPNKDGSARDMQGRKNVRIHFHSRQTGHRDKYIKDNAAAVRGLIKPHTVPAISFADVDLCLGCRDDPVVGSHEACVDETIRNIFTAVGEAAAKGMGLAHPGAAPPNAAGAGADRGEGEGAGLSSPAPMPGGLVLPLDASLHIPGLPSLDPQQHGMGMIGLQGLGAGATGMKPA